VTSDSLSTRHMTVQGVQDDMGWYGKALTRSDILADCTSALTSLGVFVDVVTLPGRERPHTRGLATFRAGESLSRQDILQTKVLIRGPADELSCIHMAHDIRDPFVNHVSGIRTRFLTAPPIPVEIPAESVLRVAETIADVVRHARTDSITLVFPQRSGPDRDATVGWLLHDIGHAIGLEGENFKNLIRPLTRLGEIGAAALESLRAAHHTATVGTSADVAMDYGPQALVNMALRGGGRQVELAGAARSQEIRRAGELMTAEIRRRLRAAKGLVAVW